MLIVRYLLLTGVAIGLARLCGFSLLEWVITACTILYTAVRTLLAGLWQIIHPSTEPQSSLPDLHQAILNVTQDATRIADLLEDFMAQYKEDPGLRDKFMAYMAAQANTHYSVVDNQLSWVLWLYSMIWMPLLIVMCFARAARSSRPPGSPSKQPAVPAAIAAGSMHGQKLDPALSQTPSLASAMAGDGAGDNYSSLHAGENLRHSMSAMYPSAAAADWPPIGPLGAGSDRSGSGSGVRAMRRSATFTPQRHSRQQEQVLLKQHRSSDSFLRAPQLPASGSFSSKRVSTSMPGSRVYHTASGAGDVQYGAGDQTR